MHIVVFGAGAVGGYFGGRLAKAGAPVTFLVREKRGRELMQRGLRAHSVHGDFVVEHPRLARSVAELASPQLVILAVKNYHLNSVLPQLRELVGQGAKVLPLLNGVEHIRVLKKALGVDAVLGGACYIEATLNAEGDIVHTSPMHDVVFGSISGGEDDEFLTELASQFERSGVNVKQSPQIMRDIWQKYLFLATFSAITAATRKPIGETLSDPVTHQFLEELVAEAVTVGQAYESTLPANTLDMVLNKFQAVAPSMTSSLHRDLEKGLPLELDSLQGAMIDMGAARAIQTPNMRALYALLHPYRDGARRTGP